VGPQDYLILCRAYGSTPGSAKWNAAADISCAGRVSAQDYLILCRNYGKKGDP
jgi:hypothetical protein